MKLQRAGNLIRENFPLRELTTIRVGGNARFFAEPETIDDLQELLHFSDVQGIPYFILGGGTNCIFQDNLIEKLVISMRKFRYLEIKDNTAVVGAGIRSSELLKEAELIGLSGLEFTIGVPATMGGMVCMNFGAFDKEISSFIKSLIVLEEGRVLLKNKSDIPFGYRSGYKNGIVLVTELTLERRPINEISQIKKELMKRKKSTQPLEFASSGCVFKNPPDDYAARLIDSLGLKGTRIGGARVSEIHANFIINQGNATYQNVKDLIMKIKEQVYEKFQVKLEEEVQRVEA